MSHPVDWPHSKRLVGALCAWLLSGPKDVEAWPDAVIDRATSGPTPVVRFAATEAGADVYDLTDAGLGWMDAHPVYACFLLDYARRLLDQIQAGDLRVVGEGDGLRIEHVWSSTPAERKTPGWEVRRDIERRLVRRATRAMGDGPAEGQGRAEWADELTKAREEAS